ncbi:MAG: DUF4861 domain-containing protein [Bacteroidales bacterium]|nr:DUF4861 domain-containing protein [Bacteroidales bacterium]
MKNIVFVLIALLVFSCSPGDGYKFAIKNSSDMPVADRGVELNRDYIAEKTGVPEDLLPVVKDQSGNYIPSQADDLDGDGSWDELFFMVDLDAGEEKKVLITFVNEEEYPEFKTRTNIRFSRKDEDYREVDFATRETHAINTETQKVWQMEGIAWENDKVGFRNYFDRRNGMDIFGKVTEEMVLDEVGYKDNPGYHEFNPDWGVDVLKVGNSLGAGSIAYMYKDSLYRVGDNGVGTCKVLVEGPLRSIFRFEFKGWKMDDQELDVVHDVTIEAGKYCYESEVTYTGTDEPLQLVTGIVNKKSDELHEVTAGNFRAFYTHDLQSEDTTTLGMGILVSEKDFKGTSTTPDTGEGITETYCVHLAAEEGKPVSFRFYSVWEREDEKWKASPAFGAFLEEEAKSASKN